MQYNNWAHSDPSDHSAGPAQTEGFSAKLNGVIQGFQFSPLIPDL